MVGQVSNTSGHSCRFPSTPPQQTQSRSRVSVFCGYTSINPIMLMKGFLFFFFKLAALPLSHKLFARRQQNPPPLLKGTAAEPGNVLEEKGHHSSCRKRARAPDSVQVSHVTLHGRLQSASWAATITEKCGNSLARETEHVSFWKHNREQTEWTD